MSSFCRTIPAALFTSNEHLAGLVAEEVRPVAVEQMRHHPRFKYFREAGEDAFQSFAICGHSEKKR
jgi:signal transduction protein with GAF and PtsI domain